MKYIFKRGELVILKTPTWLFADDSFSDDTGLSYPDLEKSILLPPPEDNTQKIVAMFLGTKSNKIGDVFGHIYYRIFLGEKVYWIHQSNVEPIDKEELRQ